MRVTLRVLLDVVVVAAWQRLTGRSTHPVIRVPSAYLSRLIHL
jgi:hypothetical protein